jgi:DNA-binding Xre family transcriptional regulator
LHTLWCIHAPYYYRLPPIKIQGRKGVAGMIKYDPLWQTLKDKNISQYQLIKDYGIDKAQLQRLRQNMVVKTIILNRLCQILDCRIEDIMEYVPDDK